jgi:hypothetical protein
MQIGLVKQNRVETVFGNIAEDVDLLQIKNEILGVYKDVYKEKSGEEAIYSVYGWYDILGIVPSLRFLQTDLLPKIVAFKGLDPAEYKFKAWFNVCFKGEFLARHVHDSTNHGYMVITNHGSRTIFELEEKTAVYENKPGQVVHMFGRYWHAVTPNKSTEPRISVAWDIFPKEQESKRIYYDLLPQ